ncbi:MAG: methionine--tRNA ligase [Muribaculaceae bacterium]|nr:methionine--tRNA ligase [Muribaculaceae bacterium]
MQNRQYKRTLVTTALPYANGPVHIGHLAGVYVPADIYVRYLRLQGVDVMFVGGSDEHGVPVTQRARREGITPQQVVDRYHELIKASFEELGISYDIYSRTTSKTHHQFAAEFFRKLYDDGKLVEKTTKQFYDEVDGKFLTDRDVEGECPYCHHPAAKGNQCEDGCGRDLDPTELINPHAKDSDHPLVLKDTTNWFLPLNEYEPWLREWILEGHQEWRPNVYGQCKSWLDNGLQPRAMTRDLDWGIPVPIEGADGKVLYVWFDAPIGYISNTKELCEQQPERWGTWQQWWQQQDTRLIHFIGKDNIVFHCIIFPTMMKAHGDYIMPDNVPANEFLNLEGDKISTSRNWAVWLHEYLKDFPGKQDVLRYVLTAAAPETKDNDFTWDDFQARNNNELVAILGNFVNRAMVLTHKYFDGIIPALGELTDYDRQTLDEFKGVKQTLSDNIENFHFREALKDAMNLARIGNKYLADTEPWKLAKTDMARVETILHVALQICANLAIAFEPFLPFSALKLRTMLAMGEVRWDKLGCIDILPAGTAILKPELLFEKIPDEVIQQQKDRLERIKQENVLKNFKPQPVAGECTYDDFTRLDIRVGRVVECEKVKKAKKLLKFRIDDGMGGRTIVSGIALYYQPEDLIGKEVCFIANFPPRPLMGIESQGMILSAEDADGRLVVIGPTGEVRPGVQVK